MYGTHRVYLELHRAFLHIFVPQGGLRKRAGAPTAFSLTTRRIMEYESKFNLCSSIIAECFDNLRPNATMTNSLIVHVVHFIQYVFSVTNK